MTDYISTPISVLNDDFNTVQTQLSAKADKSEITAFITEDALSDYATETYVQEYVAEHGGGSVDISACLSTDEFASESYLPADPFGELDVNSVSLVDLGNKLNKVIQLLKRDADGPSGGDPTKTYVEYLDGTVSAFSITGNLNSGLQNKDNAVKVKLGNTVTKIEGTVAGSPLGGSNLKTIILPNSLTALGGSSIKGCSSISTLIIPSSVTTIAHAVFQGCTSLQILTIPNTVSSIGGLSFYSCPATVTFEGKTMAEVQAMSNYSWGISTGQGKIICTDGTL